MTAGRTFLRCLSVALNSICAGGIFTFPLMSPVLSEHLRLSQPQLTTIVLAGMMNQYTVASVVGKVIDVRGPSYCSLIAAVLFVLGWGGFAATTSYYPDIPSPSESLSIFRNLTLAFFFAGMGTVFGYFASLFAAPRFFPNYPGFASSTSMALFGLSPLFLSSIASSWFTNPETNALDVTKFTSFLAVLSAFVYLLGVYSLRLDNDVEVDTVAQDHESDYASVSETTSLLAKVPPPATDGTILDLLKNSDFWLMVAFCICTLGASEMVISNIGTIVLSLPPFSIESIPSDVTAKQVKLLSLSNTISKLTVGAMVDYVSPVASYLPNVGHTFPRKHRITRIAFLALSALILASTFLWMKTRVLTRDDVWALSIGTGIGYSVIFTVLPSIVSSMWGLSNLGRNFGIMMYAPFVGNPLFSYLYAFVSEAHASGGGVCRGRTCWEATFSYATATSIFSLLISLELWRRWKNRL